MTRSNLRPMFRHIILLELLGAEAERLGLDPHDIDEIVALRVSTKMMVKLKGQIGAVGAFAGNGAVGPWLEKHGDHLAQGDKKELAAHHIIRVEEGHLVPGHVSRARVGYFAFISNPESGRWTVLVAVADTAVGRKLPSKEVAGGLSSWVQLITWTWGWAAAARTLRFVRDDRMARDLEVFAPINGRVMERPGAVYWWGDERIDPRKDTWRAVIGATTSTDDATGTKERTFAGRASGWAAGEWTEKAEYLPPGLHLPGTIDERGVASTSRRPAIDPGQAPIVQRMWEHCAQGWTMLDIGVEAAAAGLRNGRGALVALQVAPLMTEGQRVQARELCSRLPSGEAVRLAAVLDTADAPVTRVARTVHRRAATEAAKRVFSYYRFYRTGILRKTWTNPLPGQVATERNHPLTFVVDDPRLVPPDADPAHVFSTAEFVRRHPDHPILKIRSDNPDRFATMCHLGFLDYDLTLPTPVRLTDTEWGTAKDNIPTGWLERRRTGHRKRQSTPTAPLSQLRWLDDGREYVIWQNHGAYEILAGAPGTGVAQATRVARVLCADMHRQLGTWLLKLADTLDTAVEPLPVLLSRAPASTDRLDPVTAALARVAQLEKACAAKGATRSGLVRDRAKCDPTTRRGKRDYTGINDQIAAVDDELDELEDQLELAQQAVETARACPPEPAAPDDDEDAFTFEVDANPLVVIGARLCHLADTGQHVDVPELSEALAWLLQNGRLLRYRDGEGRDVHLDVTAVRLPGRDQTELVAGTTLTLLDTRGRIRGKPIEPTAPTLQDEAARYVLRDGNAAGFLNLRGWTHTTLVEALRDWLRDRGVAAGAATAILDAALAHDPEGDGRSRIPVGPVIYAWLTTSTDQHGTDKIRRQAAATAAAGLGAASMTDPIIQAYIDHGDQLPGRSTGWVRRPLTDLRRVVDLLAAQPRGQYARADVAHRLNVTRKELRDLLAASAPHQVVAGDNSSLWLLDCRRRKCNGQMTVVVAVPETMLTGTDHGTIVACDRCHRPPGPYWTRRPLPPVYRQRWDAPAARVNLHNPGHRSRVAPHPPAGTAQLPQRTYSMASAARALRISTGSLRRLIDDGAIRAAANHNRRGGYRIPAGQLERDDVKAAATALRERRHATSHRGE